MAEMKAYFIYGFEILTVLLGIGLFISAFLFLSKGLISRKTLLVSYVGFVFFMISLWITAVLTKPSIALPTLFCLASIVVVMSLSFAIKYFTLPTFNRYIEKKTRKRDDED